MITPVVKSVLMQANKLELFNFYIRESGFARFLKSFVLSKCLLSLVEKL